MRGRKSKGGERRGGEGKAGGKGKGRTTAIPNLFRPWGGGSVRILYNVLYGKIRIPKVKKC